MNLSLEEQLKQAQARIAELEAMQARHLPYVTAEEIENAEAALLYAKRAARERRDMIENALAHLQKARQGNKIKNQGRDLIGAK